LPIKPAGFRLAYLFSVSSTSSSISDTVVSFGGVGNSSFTKVVNFSIQKKTKFYVTCRFNFSRFVTSVSVMLITDGILSFETGVDVDNGEAIRFYKKSFLFSIFRLIFYFIR